MRITVLLLGIILLQACKQEPKVESQFMDKTEKKTGELLAEANIPLKKVMGQFSPEDDNDFVLVEEKYADRAGMYIHKQTYDSFKKMWADAQKDGVALVVRSATRNFDYQKGIWERKWSGVTKVSGQDLSKTMPIAKERAVEILHYSSMPGTSRHHWGTDLDFNAFENSYFESGKGLEIYNWLLANASTYGFFRPYTAKGEARPHGYEEEKWHWSFAPLADEYMKTANSELNDSLIEGFEGAETAPEIKVVEKYVKGVSTFTEQK